MRNLRTLTNTMYDMLEKVATDRRMCPQAKEVANLSGKIINGHRLQLEYFKLRKTPEKIPFLETETTDGV